MRGGEAVEALGKDGVDGIHQLLHDGTSLRAGDHSMSSTNFRSRRAKSAIIASTPRLRLASPRSGTESETMRVRGTAWTRAKRRRGARREAARKSRRSSLEKRQSSNLVFRYATRVGPRYGG